MAALVSLLLLFWAAFVKTTKALRELEGFSATCSPGLAGFFFQMLLRTDDLKQKQASKNALCASSTAVAHRYMAKASQE